jgi:hypothetical protein
MLNNVCCLTYLYLFFFIISVMCQYNDNLSSEDAVELTSEALCAALQLYLRQQASPA